MNDNHDSRGRGPTSTEHLIGRTRANGALSGRLRVPGDKSISHRALIIGGLTAGTSEIRGLADSEDVAATAGALRALGVRVHAEEPLLLRIDGVGTGGFTPSADVIDCGNSGTTARLLLGALAGHSFSTILTGDASLRRRPMGRVADPLTGMGARFVATGTPKLPITIIGSDDLVPVAWKSTVASAQVKTSILLAGLHTRGETSVQEPAPSRDHGERMLQRFGARIRTGTANEGGVEVGVTGGDELVPCRVDIPGDISSAAFPLVSASLLPGSKVEIEGVGVNPLRTGILDALRAMGVDIQEELTSSESGEPVANLCITAPTKRLRAIDLGPEFVPRTIDEYPVLAVAAAFADGVSRFRGLHELRVKESDRLEAVRAGLEASGIRADIKGDDLLVEGVERPMGGSRIDAVLDHRIAMAFLVLGMASQEPVEVQETEAVRTSWPKFADAMRSIGADINISPAVP